MELLKLNYLEFKEEQEKKANECIDGKVYFAFGTSKEEVKTKLEEQGVSVENVVGIGAGGYILKECYDDVLKFFVKQSKELKEFTLNNLNEALVCEFANYELEISLSYSYKTFLTDVLGFTEAEIEENKDEINKAIADYKEDFYKYNWRRSLILWGYSSAFIKSKGYSLKDVIEYERR